LDFTQAISFNTEFTHKTTIISASYRSFGTLIMI